MSDEPMRDTKAHMVLRPRPVTVGTFRATDSMRDRIAEVLDSGRISYGPMSRAFERQFAALHNCSYAVLSNSGTSSLHVAIQALKELHGWDDGDEVLVPASTFVATVNVVLHNNLTPIFVDVEPLTWGIDPGLIERAISKRTRAILVAHLYGQSCRMREILQVAEARGLLVVEDSCEAMFVTHNNTVVGSMGAIGCFSTYNAHLICTGVGGLCTTSNPDYARKIRSLVNHGLALDELNTDEDFSPRPNPGRSFRFTHAGHSYRITELEAAIGLAQLETHKEMLAGRRRNARHLTAGLTLLNRHADARLTLPMVLPVNEHAWMMYPIVLDRDRMPKHLVRPYLNRADIETRDMMPITNQPIYRDLLHRQQDRFPMAEWVNENGLYVGCHQDLTPQDCEYVVQVFGRWLNV